MKTAYTVQGMSCQHCVNHITEEVSQIPGVKEIAISLENGSMTITSDDAIDFAAISQAVDEAGNYTVSAA